MNLTTEQELLLEMLAKELNGKLSFLECINKTTQHKQIVIEYAKQKR